MQATNAPDAEVRAEPGLRRRFAPRFSLKWLLLAVTLCTVWTAWMAATARKQREVRAELTKLDVSVYMQDEGPTPSNAPSSLWAARRRLAQHVDENLVLSVATAQTRYLEEPSLRAGATYTPRKVVGLVSQLPRLRNARLTHSEISNEDLRDLSALRHLTRLDLSMTRLHEGPLDSLSDLNLTSLSLARTRVDDESVRSLAGMDSLVYLDLTRTKVTAKGVSYIEDLPNLKTLRIRRCLVSREEYEALQDRHPKLSIKWQAMPGGSDP